MSNEAHRAMQAAKLDALIQSVKDAMPAEIRKADMLAEIRRVHYEASIRKGFTPDEALVLCMDTSL